MEFETEAASRKMVATALRSFEQWDAHPQGQALAETPPVTVRRVGDAPRRQIGGKPNRPLDGIRVLDLTRVLAGPICGRTLAGKRGSHNMVVTALTCLDIVAHGADVLWVTSPKLPALPMLDLDTSRGKRTTQLDLNEVEGHKKLTELLKDADVFLQAYRPGGLASKGFAVDEVAKLRPGIVYASLCAYGWEGPWKDRRGVCAVHSSHYGVSHSCPQFDSLVQTATGFNVAEAEAYASFSGTSGSSPLPPKPFPMQALDHAAGYMLALGIQAALSKTITVCIHSSPRSV